MVFKRRDRRPIWRMIQEAFWPRGGWTRAFTYVRHRLRRLPDPPHRVARGIFAGVFVSFTPLFGFHFLAAAAVAGVLRANILAALLATFIGNPLTFPFIAALSLGIGHSLLGHGWRPEDHKGVLENFAGAASDIWNNIIAIFTPAPTQWGNLQDFFFDLFLPYLVGGIVPGITAGVVCYYLSLPVLIAYQNRREGRAKARLKKLRRKPAIGADGGPDLP